MVFKRNTWANYPWHVEETVWFDGIMWRKKTSRRFYKAKKDEAYVETRDMTLAEAVRWFELYKLEKKHIYSRVA